MALMKTSTKRKHTQSSKTRTLKAFKETKNGRIRANARI